MNVQLKESIRNGTNLKGELDEKKVRILELETENGELKTVIEQLSKDMQNIRNNQLKGSGLQDKDRVNVSED